MGNLNGPSTVVKIFFLFFSILLKVLLNNFSGDILDGEVLMPDEETESKNGNNFICLLTPDDYDKLESNPWASFHAYLDYFETTSPFKTSAPEAEASKRYVRSGS